MQSRELRDAQSHVTSEYRVAYGQRKCGFPVPQTVPDSTTKTKDKQLEVTSANERVVAVMQTGPSGSIRFHGGRDLSHVA